MATGLPVALCRLVTVSTTPVEQKLQCLAMLRVMVSDERTHALLVENKVNPGGHNRAHRSDARTSTRCDVCAM
jgi:hypothetical protein